MDLLGFSDVDTKNREAMLEFLDRNAAAHETIYNTLSGVYQIVIEHYPLFNRGYVDKDWLNTHDKEHKAIANALSLGDPPDLDAVDFEDEESATDWLNSHYLIHRQIEEAIGL